MGSPELDTVLQMGPHQGRAEGEENSLDMLATLCLMHPTMCEVSLRTGVPVLVLCGESMCGFVCDILTKNTGVPT